MARAAARAGGLSARPLLAVVVLSAVPGALAQDTTPDPSSKGSNGFVTQKDVDLANRAFEKTGLYCKNVPSEDEVVKNKAAGKEDLNTALGGKNFILDELKEAENQADLAARMQRHLNLSMLVRSAAAAVLGFFVLVCWFLWCWTACIRACRCKEQSRNVKPPVKGVFGGLLVVGLCLILYGIIVGITGHSGFAAGLHLIACASATVLNTTLSGTDNPRFIGMLPALEFFDAFSNELLNNDSDLVMELNVAIRATGEIDAASVLALGVVQLFQDMMANPANQAPRDTSGDDLWHRCIMCTELAGPLSQLDGTLSTGLAGALRDARKQVGQIVGWESRRNLAAQVNSAPGPLASFKDQLAGSFGAMVSGEFFPTFKQHIDGSVFYGLLLMSLFAIVYWLVAAASWWIWLVSPSTKEKDYEIGEEMLRHRRLPVSLSLCVWYCSPCCIFPALLVGGILLTVSIPMSAMCLTLDAVDSQMLDDISTGLGLNLTGDQGDQIKDLVDQCLVMKDGPNANMMDIIFVRNGTDKVTLRQQFEQSVLDPVKGAFDAVAMSQNMSGGDTDLKSEPSIASLISLVSKSRIDASMLPKDEMKTAARWASLKNIYDNSKTPPITAFSTSLSCAAPAVGSFAYGLETYAVAAGKKAAIASQAKRGTTCAYQVANCAGNADCLAYNDYMDLKYRMFTQKVFRCDLFADADGQACDPKDMVFSNGLQVYTSDCLIPGGTAQDRVYTLERKERYCNMNEFADYVQEMGKRMNVTLDRVSTASREGLRSVGEDLRHIMDVYFLGPLDNIVNGLTCGFLGRFYQGAVLGGFCFSSVPGLRALAQALVIFGLAVLWVATVDYIMWRLQVDNVSREDEFDQNAKVGATE